MATKNLLLLFSFALLTACADQSESTAAANEDLGYEPSKGEYFGEFVPEPLPWESANKPERKVWSQATFDLVDKYFTTLDLAKDIHSFCPNYDNLSREQKVNAWGALISGTTYYESGYNPKSYSVDVGKPDNPDTWSVGLLQMSVVDQKNYGFHFGFSFEDLKHPIKNLQLGFAIFSRQIARYGQILIPVGAKGLYWAVLHPGGKYDASAKIMKMVQKLTFCR